MKTALRFYALALTASLTLPQINAQYTPPLRHRDYSPAS